MGYRVGINKYPLQDASTGASIFLGGLEAAHRAVGVNPIGFNYIVDCRGDPEKGRFSEWNVLPSSKEVNYIHLEVNRMGCFGATSSHLKFEGEFRQRFLPLARAIAAGGRILIFCINGANRSPRIALTVDLALNYVEAKSSLNPLWPFVAQAATMLQRRRTLVDWTPHDDRHAEGRFQAWYYCIEMWKLLQELGVHKSRAEREHMSLARFNEFFKRDGPKHDLVNRFLDFVDSTDKAASPEASSHDPSAASSHKPKAKGPEQNPRPAWMGPTDWSGAARDQREARKCGSTDYRLSQGKFSDLRLPPKGSGKDSGCPVQIEYTAAAMRVREGQLSSFRRDSLIARASDSEERTIPADSPEALPEPEASIGEVCPINAGWELIKAEPEASIGEVCPINDGINAGWQLIKDRWAPGKSRARRRQSSKKCQGSR